MRRVTEPTGLEQLNEVSCQRLALVRRAVRFDAGCADAMSLITESYTDAVCATAALRLMTSRTCSCPADGLNSMPS